MMQILIAVDQLINALFRGWADETLSARAYRNAAQGHPRWTRIKVAIDTLFFWQHQHCERAYQVELARQQLPPQYRTPTTTETRRDD